MHCQHQQCYYIHHVKNLTLESYHADIQLVAPNSKYSLDFSIELPDPFKHLNPMMAPDENLGDHSGYLVHTLKSFLGILMSIKPLYSFLSFSCLWSFLCAIQSVNLTWFDLPFERSFFLQSGKNSGKGGLKGDPCASDWSNDIYTKCFQPFKVSLKRAKTVLVAGCGSVKHPRRVD